MIELLTEYARNGIYIALGKTGQSVWANGQLTTDERLELEGIRADLHSALVAETYTRDHVRLATESALSLHNLYRGDDCMPTTEYVELFDELDKATSSRNPSAVRLASAKIVRRGFPVEPTWVRV